MKLDAKTIASLTLPPGKDDHIEWDDDLHGFGARLRQGKGRRSKGRPRGTYITQYRVSGRRTRRVTLGKFETLSPAQAREAARKLLARVALGDDPQAARESQRARAARTFRSAVEAYLAAKRPELRPVSYRISKLYLLDGTYLRPLHPLGVNEITHPDVAARLSAIARNRSPDTAAATRRAISAAFRWFMEEGWTTTNPVIGTRRPPDPKPGEHVLTDAELAKVWSACRDDDFGRIACATGERSTKACVIRGKITSSV